jgi:serine/threonine-protein kinase
VAGRYRVVEALGGGGTSLVYRAEVLAGGAADVALKELRPQFAADAALRRRFVREAELVRHLDHPGIVSVLDAGEPDGVPFLVMELMRAETLRQLMDRRGRLPLPLARSVITALARALDHAHGRGVIHRDDGGLVKLADFGNARVVSLASVTGASLTWGTPEYIAPEVFTRGRADPRSDLFALGVVLYEMLTGRHPWTRVQAVARLGGGAGSVPRVAPTGAGPEIDRLIAELLASSPADRPASGEELIARLLEPEAPAIVRRIACAGCGAERAVDVPRCLSCGREGLRLRHDPSGGGGRNKRDGDRRTHTARIITSPSTLLNAAGSGTCPDSARWACASSRSA